MSAITSIVRRVVPDDAWPANIHPVLARVYSARGIHSPEQADLKLARLLPPDTLGHLDAATKLLAQAIREDWREMEGYMTQSLSLRYSGGGSACRKRLLVDKLNLTLPLLSDMTICCCCCC